MSTPVRDITKGITSHFRYKDGKDRYVYEVVEEIKRAFKKLQAMLDKPTLGGGIPGSPGTDGQAGGGGDDSDHIFDGPNPVKVKLPSTDPRLMRVKGTVGDRLVVKKFYAGLDQSMDLIPVDVLLHDSTILQSTPTAQVYRGIREYGLVGVRLATSGTEVGPGPNQIHNGNFEGGTYQSRSTTNPTDWTIADDGTAALVSPGAGGTGFCLSIDVTSGQTCATRRPLSTYILGGSPSGGTNTCTGDAGGPGLTNGTVSYFTAEKNKTYTLSFKMRLFGSSTGTRQFDFSVLAHPNSGDFKTCAGSTGYSLTGTSASGALTVSAGTWNSARTSSVRFVDVPDGTVFQTYTVTIDTTGVGSDVPDTFYVVVVFGGGLSGSGSWQIDDLEWRDPNTVITTPTVIHAPIILRGFADDEWVIQPEVTGDGNELTLEGAEGALFRPLMAPIAGAGTTVGVNHAYGARFGFAYDGSEMNGTAVFDDVASIFLEEPGFGTDPQALSLAGALSLRAGKKLRFYGPADIKYSSIRAQNQSANIDYELPMSAPINDGDVLAAHLTGETYWTPQTGGGGGGGYPEALGFGGI